MPSVIETPVIEEEGVRASTNKTLASASAACLSTGKRLPAFISRRALRDGQRCGPEIQRQDAPGMLVDILARQQPYIYIKALAG